MKIRRGCLDRALPIQFGPNIYVQTRLADGNNGCPIRRECHRGNRRLGGECDIRKQKKAY